MQRRDAYGLLLSKYDAPLRLQYTQGYEAYRRWPKLVKSSDGKRKVYHVLRPSSEPNTMQYREWMRGWNDAYAGRRYAYEEEEEKKSGFKKRS